MQTLFDMLSLQWSYLERKVDGTVGLGPELYVMRFNANLPELS